MHTYRLRLFGPIVLGFATLLFSRTAWAQPPASGPIVSGTFAAAVANNSTNLSFGGSVGYRFNRAFGLAAEMTSMNGIDQSGREVVPLLYPVRRRADTDLLMFTTNVRIEVPTTSSRIVPFAIAGGGVASASTKLRFDQPNVFADIPGLDASVVSSLQSSFPNDYGVSQTFLAFTLGGGVSFMVNQHFSIDADLREIHLAGENGGDIGRFGGGASFRF